MIRSGLVCVLLAGFAWGQAEKANLPASVPETPIQDHAAAKIPSVDKAADNLPPDYPVITIAGLCDYAKTGKVFDPKCKWAVTRAEFDLMVKVTKPGTKPEARRSLAKPYIQNLIESQKALEMGYDKLPHFESRVEVLRLLFYSTALNRELEDKEWKGVTDKEIADYYQNNPGEFVVADVERVFLPRFPPDEKPGEKLTDAEKQKRQEEWDRALKEKADSLRSRAVAGEDFVKLQNDAYAFTGVTQVQGPDSVVLRRMRRRHFDPDQKSVMDLKPGEVSLPLYDETRGYCIFKVDTRGMYDLDPMKPEIHKLFQTERVKHDMQTIQKEATVVYNDAYLGPPSSEDKEVENRNGQLPPPAETSSK